ALIADGELDEATFLGAHLVPGEFSGRDGAPDADDYVDLVSGEMLTAVAPHVRWIDVFCEQGAFDPEQSQRVLRAGAAAGLGLRVHGNQLGRSGGVALATELGAASVDHVNHLDAADVEALAATASRATRPGDRPGRLAVDAGPTVATALPACDLSTRAPLAPARALLAAGAPVAIASNCNPGTSYTSAMSFCVTTAELQMHLTLAAAIRAAPAAPRWPRRGCCGAPGPPSRSRATATPAPATPVRGASASPLRCCRCTSRSPRRAAPPPAAGRWRCAAPTSATSGSVPAPTCTCSTPPPRSTSPTGPACRSPTRCGARADVAPETGRPASTTSSAAPPARLLLPPVLERNPMPRTSTVTLASSGLTAAEVLAVARHRARVELDPAAREHLASVRAHIDALAAGETPVYG